MANQISTTQAPPVETALDMARSLRVSLSRREAMDPAQIRALSIPANRQWIAGRAGTLLANYYVSPLPPEMQAAIAEDWIAELSIFPAWAIQNACRWWIGEGNDKRRQKPQPGDIAQRARVEMGVVRLAQQRLDGVDFSGASNRAAAPATTEEAKKILEMAGFQAKKMRGKAQ